MKLNIFLIYITLIIALFIVACKDNNVEKVNELLAQIEGLQESINKASNSSREDDGNITVNPSAVDKEQALQNMISDLEDEMKELRAKNDKELALKKNEAAELSDLISRIEKGGDAVLNEIKDELKAKKNSIQQSIDSSKSEFEEKKSEMNNTITDLQAQLTEKEDNSSKMEKEIITQRNELVAKSLGQLIDNLKSVTTARVEEGNPHNEYVLIYTDKELTIKHFDSGVKEENEVIENRVGDVVYKRNYTKTLSNGKKDKIIVEYLDKDKNLYSGSNSSHYSIETSYYYNHTPETIANLNLIYYDLVRGTPSQIVQQEYKGNSNGGKQPLRTNIISFDVEVAIGGIQVSLYARESNNLRNDDFCKTGSRGKGLGVSNLGTSYWSSFGNYPNCYVSSKGIN